MLIRFVHLARIGAIVLVVLLIQSGSAWMVRGVTGQTSNYAPRALTESFMAPFAPAVAEASSPTYRLFLPTALANPTSPTYHLFLPTIFNRFPLQTIFGADTSTFDTNSGFEQMAQAGVYWVRTDTVVSWAAVEPVEGTRNWSVLANLAQGWQTASNRGIEPIVVVRVTPSWAQQVAGSTCGPIKSDKLNSFASFMNELVARYSVPPYNVKYWEIWNEPDIDYRLVSPTSDWGCWGNQDDAHYGGGYYATMLKTVYPQIKAASSSAQVLVGGLLLDCDPRGSPSVCTTVHPGDPNAGKPPEFLEGILLNGGGSFFDGISFHAYDYYYGALGQYANPNWQSAWNTTGSVTIAKAQFIKSVLNTYGVTNKFLMNTESAVLCSSCASDATYEATKAYYVAQAYAAALAEGLRANMWYSVMGWNNSGLLNPDLSPRPGHTAFQVSRTELRDSVFTGVLTPTDAGGSSQIKGYKFNRGDRRVWVVWSLDGNAHSITPNLGIPLAVVDALGTAVTPASTMTVDLKPLYLEWAP